MTLTDDPTNTQRRKIAETMHRGLERILEAQGFAPEAVAGLLEFDAQMFRWRSLQNKGEFLTLLARRAGQDLELGVMLGLLAVSRLTIGLEGSPPAPPTIGEVAEELKLDPSRASRIVAELVEKGYLKREADQADGRRSVLIITPKGSKLMGEFRDAKWQVMSELFNDWGSADISDFARLMTRYLDGLTALTTR